MNHIMVAKFCVACFFIFKRNQYKNQSSPSNTNSKDVMSSLTNQNAYFGISSWGKPYLKMLFCVDAIIPQRFSSLSRNLFKSEQTFASAKSVPSQQSLDATVISANKQERY